MYRNTVYTKNKLVVNSYYFWFILLRKNFYFLEVLQQYYSHILIHVSYDNYSFTHNLVKFNTIDNPIEYK